MSFRRANGIYETTQALEEPWRSHNKLMFGIGGSLGVEQEIMVEVIVGGGNMVGVNENS